MPDLNMGCCSVHLEGSVVQKPQRLTKLAKELAGIPVDQDGFNISSGGAFEAKFLE